MDQRHGTPVPSDTPSTSMAMPTREESIMNVRLFDGSVRCGDHFDASSFASETTDPCTYCPPATAGWDAPPADWERELLIFAQVGYRATVRMGKGLCAWCSEPAMWDVSDPADGRSDPCCTEHRDEWFPGAIIPVSLHKIVTRPVPAEWELEMRRVGGIRWIPALPGHAEGLAANDLITFQSAISLQFLL